MTFISHLMPYKYVHCIHTFDGKEAVDQCVAFLFNSRFSCMRWHRKRNTNIITSPHIEFYPLIYKIHVWAAAIMTKKYLTKVLLCRNVDINEMSYWCKRHFEYVCSSSFRIQRGELFSNNGKYMYDKPIANWWQHTQNVYTK